MTALTSACAEAWEGVSSLALFVGAMLLSLSLDFVPDGAGAAAAAGTPVEQEIASVSTVCPSGLGHRPAPGHCIPRL